MNQIAAFNGLRFFITLVILFFHFGFEFRLKNYLFTQGRLGVELFFILSGFLLALTHEKSTAVSSSHTSKQLCINYFIRRFIRLWPEYIFTLVLAAFLLGRFNKSFLLSIFMIPCYPGVTPILNVFWYIPILFIYSCLLFNLLLFTKDKAKTIIFPSLALLCLFFLLNDKSHFISLNPNATARGLLGLITGMYTYWGCQTLKTCKISWRPQFITAILLIGEIISTLGLGYLFVFRKGYNIDTFNVYFYASFLIGLLFLKREKLLKFLSWKIWVPFAKISYSLYLTHDILLIIAKEHYLPYITTHILSSSVLFALIAIIFATLCYFGQSCIFIFLKKIALQNSTEQ